MENQQLTFKSELLLAGKTATGVEVPAEVVEKLGSTKNPPVKVTINDYTYPSTIAVRNGVFMLPVSAEVREKAGIKSGEIIEVSVTSDNQPRVVEVPTDFQDALDKNLAAKQYFETLSNSNKKYFIGSIEQAKTQETRIRRIEKAIIDLEQKKKV
jgi:bifunctional DNA-binding transcriptional regulator/antitoxin component of YhaV-PrlF toxin-antitoxin module